MRRWAHCFRGRRRVRVMAEVKNSPSKVCRSRASSETPYPPMDYRGRGIPLRDFFRSPRTRRSAKASDATCIHIAAGNVESVPTEQFSPLVLKRFFVPKEWRIDRFTHRIVERNGFRRSIARKRHGKWILETYMRKTFIIGRLFLRPGVMRN